MARPTKYTKVLGEKICERLASGESLNSICRDDDVPHKVTIMRWLLSDSDVYKEFRNQYALARQIQYEFLADDIIDISDDGSNDFIAALGDENASAAYRFNGEAVARSRLRVDTRKWFLSKVLPKFSDKQEQTKTDADKLSDIIANLIDKLPN